MAPPSVKKYENRTLRKRSRSELAVNTVLVKNLFARTQKNVKTTRNGSILDKYAVPDLPAADTNHVLLNDSEDSLHVKKDDTFDKLVNNMALSGRKLRSGRVTLTSNDSSSLNPSNTNSDTSKLNLSFVKLSYSSAFHSGAAKGKKLSSSNNSNQEEFEKEIDVNLDNSISRTIKDNLGEIGMCSTPIVRSKQLKAANITPVNVPGRHFKSPELEECKSVVRTRRKSLSPLPLSSLLVEYKRERFREQQKPAFRRKQRSNRKKLPSKGNKTLKKQQTIPLKIRVNKLPDDFIYRLIKKQNSHCKPETLSNDKQNISGSEMEGIWDQLTEDKDSTKEDDVLASSSINGLQAEKPVNNMCSFESFYTSMINSIMADDCSINEYQETEVHVAADDTSRLKECDSLHQSQCHILSEPDEVRCFVTHRKRLPTRGEDISCFATPFKGAPDKHMNQIKKNVYLQSPDLFSSSTSEDIDADIFADFEKENQIPIPSPTRRKKNQVDKIVLLAENSGNGSPFDESRKTLNHVVDDETIQGEVSIPCYNSNSAKNIVQHTKLIRRGEPLAICNKDDSINKAGISESNITIDDTKEETGDNIDDNYIIDKDELYKNHDSIEYQNFEEISNCQTNLSIESQEADNFNESQVTADENEYKTKIEFDIDTNINHLVNDTSSLYEESLASVSNLEDVAVIKVDDKCEKVNNSVMCKKKISNALKDVQAGKGWRRNLALIRKNTLVISVFEGDKCDCSTCDSSTFNLHGVYRRKTLKVLTPIPDFQSKIIEYERDFYDNSRLRAAFTNLIEIDTRNRIACRDPPESSNSVARELILEKCNQAAPITFSECYPDTALKNCMKIGEGVYGEVFLCRRGKSMSTMVMKVIPIEGEILVNGERQKQYEEILSEIVIASELTRLRKTSRNRTFGFNQLINVRCVQGKYPPRLIELWELYENSKGTENDNPSMFGSDQIYIVLELANAGTDLESFIFRDYKQVFYCFLQVALSLAVAEEELKFEHRDLHWGNVLIRGVGANGKCDFKLQGENIIVPDCSALANIIDFTLSRITCKEMNFYYDLSQDPDLFNAEGDYQFEIYKLMQVANRNNWELFEPKTNILWLHYLLVKMTTSINLMRPTIEKKHKKFFVHLAAWETQILNCDSALQFVDKQALPIFKRLSNCT